MVSTSARNSEVEIRWGLGVHPVFIPRGVGVHNCLCWIDLDQSRHRRGENPPANAVTDAGLRVGARTEGLLKPAPTFATAIDIIGRESRRWGDGRGILTPPDINTYMTRTDPEAVARLLRRHYYWPGAAQLIADKTGLSVRTVGAILAGEKPTKRTAERLWEFAYQQELTFDNEEASNHA